MLLKIAAFEFRYQLTGPLFIAAAALFFAVSFFDMAAFKLVSEAGGTVLFNAPHAIIKHHLLVSLLFPFVGAAFVANVILRDDLTGFGPLLRATALGKRDYLLGRFLGASAIGVIIITAATVGMAIGTWMPFANQAMLGPNDPAGFAYGLLLFALPNALVVFAVLFALTTATRSTAGTFVGVVGILLLYLVGQRLMEGQAGIQTFRALLDPLGMSAYMAASRYLTASEINAGAIPVTGLMIVGRLMWAALSLALLALTIRRFSFTDAGLSPRQWRAQIGQSDSADVQFAAQAIGIVQLARPDFGTKTAITQFLARAGLEAQFILRSPVFWILLLIAFTFALPGLLTVSTIAGTPIYPVTSALVPVLDDSFRTLLVVIAAYFGGELVWRERERQIDPIIDAAPLPAWALMAPKFLGLACVLLATLLVSAIVAMALQAIDGEVEIALDRYLGWYLLPRGLDAVVTAALAVFVQSLSPSKYTAWGIMAIYIVVLLLGPALGISHPLMLYGAVPDTPMSDLAGTGFSGEAAWWMRAFWSGAAALLLIGAHLLWPRGVAQSLRVRLRRALSGARDLTLATGLILVGSLLLCGGWIVWNTEVLNDHGAPADAQRYLAEYERRYLRYASIPQPVVNDVKITVALDPAVGIADVRGTLRLVNQTTGPIDTIHIRLGDPGLELVDLHLPGAYLELDDRKFDYRIYRLDRPMRPYEARTVAFRTKRERWGFALTGGTSGVLPNGTELDAFALTPRIGMHDSGLLEDPAVRHEMGLPRARPLPRLENASAVAQKMSDNAWVTTDITVSTSADQLGVAPGKMITDRVGHGRRTTRYVSMQPIQNSFSIQSGRFAVERQVRDGIEYTVFYDPTHHWNVGRIMTAMEASIETYSRAFGPYQFDHVRAVEAAYRDGAHAYPGVIAMGELTPFAVDLRDDGTIDMATLFVAHELSHQWWGHQVRGTRMEGTAVLIETLAQYSALMVLEKQRGGAGIDDYLAYQLDRYLKGRRASVTGELPLIRVGTKDPHIAYGKGALAMYLLKDRMGDAAVNRALAGLVKRYGMSEPPYPRSLDLVAALRAQAGSPEIQALITDLFERVTLYDLKLGTPTARRRSDGKWDVTVPVEGHKFYADETGKEAEVALIEAIDFSISGADGTRDLSATRTIRSGRQTLRFVTHNRPSGAALDPHGLFIDRDRNNNFAEVGLVK